MTPSVRGACPRRRPRGVVSRLPVAIPVLSALLSLSTPAAGQTLVEAMALAYQSNPTLEAERANVREINEQVAQVLSGYRPTVTGDASAGRTWQSTNPSFGRSSSDVINPAAIGITVDQPLYRGGQGDAAIERADHTVAAARAALTSVEQSVLFDAARAYIDIVQAQALLDLAVNNEIVLRRELMATRDRFEVGEIPRTDVSQSESRLAGATADRISADGTLQQNRATFVRVIGASPAVLMQPPPLGTLPVSLDEAVTLAGSSNPTLLAAQFNEAAAASLVDERFAELLPSLSLQVRMQSAFEPSASVDSSALASITAQLQVPLYQAGLASSRIRQARFSEAEARLRVDEARRQVTEEVILAWQSLATARATIQSRRAAVEAASVALDGVRQEAQVGSRTVLDVLNAEQERLNARVSLISAERDALVAEYRVMASVGTLTAAALNLPVQYYELEADYARARSSWYGTSIE